MPVQDLARLGLIKLFWAKDSVRFGKQVVFNGKTS
jgi:hypothetical protein